MTPITAPKPIKLLTVPALEGEQKNSDGYYVVAAEWVGHGIHYHVIGRRDFSVGKEFFEKENSDILKIFIATAEAALVPLVEIPITLSQLYSVIQPTLRIMSDVSEGLKKHGFKCKEEI